MTNKINVCNNSIISGAVATVVCLIECGLYVYGNLVNIPRPIPSFSVLHTAKQEHATLKSWEWAWGRGYVYVYI